MYWVKKIICIFVGCFLGAQSFDDDPVMKIRMQRSQTQGVNESDLPPVPRSVMEPPPLPLPEVHAKDAIRPLIVINPTKIFIKKIVYASRTIKPKLASKYDVKFKNVHVARGIQVVRNQPISSRATKKLSILRKTKGALPSKVVHKEAIKAIEKHKTLR